MQQAGGVLATRKPDDQPGPARKDVGQARSRRRLGETVEILVDGTAKKNAGELSGRTRCNRVVNFDGQGRVAVGDLTWVRVTEALPHSLRGELARRAEEAACLSK